MATLIERKSQQVEPGASDILDEPAFDVFTFRANRTGEATLEFIYDTPWNPNEAQARQFTLNFEVSKPGRGQSKMQQASVTVDQQ
jgi:predicted secreted protein